MREQTSTRLPVRSTCAEDTHRQLLPFDAPGARHHGHTASFLRHVPSQHTPRTETRPAFMCLLRMVRRHSHGSAGRRQTQQQERTGGLIQHIVRRRKCLREMSHTGVPQRVPARYVRHRVTQELAHADVPEKSLAIFFRLVTWHTRGDCLALLSGMEAQPCRRRRLLLLGRTRCCPVRWKCLLLLLLLLYRRACGNKITTQATARTELK